MKLGAGVKARPPGRSFGLALAPETGEKPVKTLELDKLEVVSFETTVAPAPVLPGISGEDCFTRLSGCCIPTRTQA
jgi:hypothetical protein